MPADSQNILSLDLASCGTLPLCGSGSLSLQSLLPLSPPRANQVAVRPEHDLVELREVTKHACRISCCHTSRRHVVGNDAARTDDGVVANADAGKDDHL